MRVVCADKLSDQGLDVLREAEGIQFDNQNGVAAEDLASAVQGARGLLVRSRTKVTEDVLRSASGLKVVGRAGIGVDNIDIGVATELGIAVMNAPSGNAVTTAEHTIALMFAVARSLAAADASMKAGRWDKKKFMGMELEGKVALVIGAGNIGAHVVRKMVGVGMKVRVIDPKLEDEAIEAMGAQRGSLEQDIEDAGVISVHVPVSHQTRGLIGPALLERARDGLIVLNVARGGIVDEAALLAAIESGKVAGAGLDVFTEEPPTSEVLKRLLARPEVIATPHLGASTYEAQVKVAKVICEQVRDFLLKGRAANVLNPEVLGDGSGS